MATTCPHCAAPIGQPDQRYCAFCGNALPRDEPPPAPRRAATAELLAEVERHPRLSEWMAHVPATGQVAAGVTTMVVFGLLFAALAVAGIAFASSFAPGFVVAFLGIFVAFGVGIALTGTIKGMRFADAPLQRVPALVVDERVRVAGGAGDRSASTSYYATLESAEGQRTEFPVDARLAGAIAAGDYGLAYLRGGYLLDFRRVGSR